MSSQSSERSDVVDKLKNPNSEAELRTIFDNLYAEAKTNFDNRVENDFRGLLEVIASEVNIVLAIHEIKTNKGSITPGTDGNNINSILTKEYKSVINEVQKSLKHYKPFPVKRVYIPKKNGKLRPLGIPAIIDRIVQQCVKQVIEPICESQFYDYSFGFRPMRSASMANSRIEDVLHHTGYKWVIEGDIKGFFDNVNHNTLIRKLWNMGIRDKRVLMIIKAMLKAGIMEETTRNEIGTPQGGIISPLLANVYLNSFDWYIAKNWDKKSTKVSYKNQGDKLRALRERSNIKPAYLVRYADDWVIITNTRENAEKIKYRCYKYLHNELKLELSDEKTKITNATNNAIVFLGWKIKKVKGKAAKGYIIHAWPEETTFDKKIKALIKEIRNTEHKIAYADKEGMIWEINLINSKIRGLINFYITAQTSGAYFRKYKNHVAYTSYKLLKKRGGKWIPANKVANLQSIHKNYTTCIPAIEYHGEYIGITALDFFKWEIPVTKNPKETPYTENGRSLYTKRSSKKMALALAPEFLNIPDNVYRHDLEHKKKVKSKAKYNFEFYMNRGYAYNRDKCKCRVCGNIVHPMDAHTHHIHNKYDIEHINKVSNLATVHDKCHKLIHAKEIPTILTDKKTINKLIKFRKALEEQ